MTQTEAYTECILGSVERMLSEGTAIIEMGDPASFFVIDHDTDNIKFRRETKWQ